MIMDGKNIFTAASTGDVQSGSFFTVGDTGSTYSIDRGVSGFTGSTVAAGGAVLQPYLVARVVTAFTSASTTLTLQIVLQESVDNSTYTDVACGGIFAKTPLTVDNTVLYCARMPQTNKRYLRVCYRVAGEAATAGAIQAFLTMDAPVIDAFLQGNATPASIPSGAMDHAQGVAVTGQIDS